MPESGFHRPRRAFAHGTESDGPVAADDTAATPAGAARRGPDSQSVDPVEESGASDSAEGAEQTSAVSENPSTSENPFARPGTEAAASYPAPEPDPLVPAPAPVIPGPDFESGETADPAGGTGSRAGEQDPRPRRSAVSSSSPPEEDAVASSAAASGTPQSWVDHHKRTLMLWGIGALVAALVIVAGAFLAGRLGSGKDDPAPIPSPSESSSPSPSESQVPTVSGADLITVSDADKIVPGASWAITKTAVTSEEAEQRVTCLSTYTSDSNPTDTFQRSMGSSEDDLLAALHQVDLYANVGAARQVQAERVMALSSCNEAPAHIRSASTITGLGDDVTQVTVALQEDPVTFHTVLLVQTGRALTMLDVTRTGSAVDADGVAAALERSLGEICERADGVCPADLAVTAAAPPPVDPAGWLVTADLPRLRAGHGRWTVTDPGDVTSGGMGCENIPLATEPGPTSRAQRTYLLTQDTEMPTTFGMDEMAFNFADNATARIFTTRLIDSLLSCKDRLLTAEITDRDAINGTGADGVAVSARLITIDQAISDDTSVRYQLVVAIADTRVSYLLASVTSSYQFSNVQMQELALRTAQRNSQG